ncbi:MAG TPA: bifunctional oligoribonuclease/PAP phosphatase NrnA [Bacteroidota bacterium]|nr:bifunctional oligoribonuclease/PAP phosphatase NrnA [Bacteroidota bacterium]
MAVLFETFKVIIDSNQNFVLTTHINPDGDGLGTECALAYFLQQIGKEVVIINHSSTPPNYEFLNQVFPITQFNPFQHSDVIEKADVIIVIDTNSVDRLGSLKPSLQQNKGVKVCIDHHPEPQEFADLYILEEASPATGEIVYRLLNYLNDREPIDKRIAFGLYTAIMTDTGSFRYPKTDPEVHKIVAHLIQAGADPVAIYEAVYEQSTVERTRLLGKALANIQLAHNGKVAYIALTKEMFEDTNTDEVDTDAFVPFTLSIAGVQVGLLFSELDDCIKINFRSKGDIRINEVAKHFGGNGHINAAGARVHNVPMKELINQVLDQIAAYLG